ncbi:MAG TPA: nuclear transport factor 2 family protein, partial [Gemmatimonadaceae bacterium]|nr:nuclear transport factor 2 family protein [Gemmatimonadaceae bacterium]
MIHVVTPATRSPNEEDAMTDEHTAEQEVRHLSDAEVDAFLHRDPAAMAQLWSDDLVVTNPLNQLVTKQA